MGGFIKARVGDSGFRMIPIAASAMHMHARLLPLLPDIILPAKTDEIFPIMISLYRCTFTRIKGSHK